MDYSNLSLLRHSGVDESLSVTYWITHGLGYLALFMSIFNFRRPALKRNPFLNTLIGVGFGFVVSKLVLFLGAMIINVICFLMGLDIPGLVVALLYAFSIGVLIAMIYGAIWGKYRFVTEHVQLTYDDLPAAFDGFKIVQISDIHAGTWDSMSGVEKGIKLIEEQNADMIVFTGDLVNSDKNEVDPFMHLFKRLKAPYGKYAVLGNHDYYGQPRDRSLRQAYYDDFFSKYLEMGFDLIMNDSRLITKDSDALRLIGVENWGTGKYFPKRGDLDKATANIDDSDFNILLSHDPSHWDIKALPHKQHFHLTLSGHTHGMQFGINLPFFKWSPVKYRYKRWMGLYEQAGQYLYVNRGFGLLAFPGRVGMSPEVTVIELKRTSGN